MDLDYMIKVEDRIEVGARLRVRVRVRVRVIHMFKPMLRRRFRCRVIVVQVCVRVWVQG